MWEELRLLFFLIKSLIYSCFFFFFFFQFTLSSGNKQCPPSVLWEFWVPDTAFSELEKGQVLHQ